MFVALENLFSKHTKKERSKLDPNKLNWIHWINHWTIIIEILLQKGNLQFSCRVNDFEGFVCFLKIDSIFLGTFSLKGKWMFVYFLFVSKIVSISWFLEFCSYWLDTDMHAHSILHRSNLPNWSWRIKIWSLIPVWLFLRFGFGTTITSPNGEWKMPSPRKKGHSKCSPFRLNWNLKFVLIEWLGVPTVLDQDGSMQVGHGEHVRFDTQTYGRSSSLPRVQANTDLQLF